MNETNLEQIRKPIKLSKKETKLMNFNEVYDKYKGYIIKMAKYDCLENELSYLDDYIQEGNIALFEAFQSYDINKNTLFTSYFFRIVKNHFAEYFKRRHRNCYDEYKILSLSDLKEKTIKNNKIINFSNLDEFNFVKSNINIEKSYEVKSLIEKSLNNFLKDDIHSQRNKSIILNIINGTSQTEIAHKLNMTRANISYIFRKFCEEFIYQYKIVI